MFLAHEKLESLVLIPIKKLFFLFKIWNMFLIL